MGNVAYIFWYCCLDVGTKDFTAPHPGRFSYPTLGIVEQDSAQSTHHRKTGYQRRQYSLKVVSVLQEVRFCSRVFVFDVHSTFFFRYIETCTTTDILDIISGLVEVVKQENNRSTPLSHIGKQPLYFVVSNVVSDND